MPSGINLLALLQTAGTSAFIFAIWYLYHQAVTSSFDKIISAVTGQFQTIIEQNEKQNERNYELLKDQIETLQVQVGVLSRIEHKIDSRPCGLSDIQKELRR